MSRSFVLLPGALLLVGLVLALAATALAHPGHPQKKLFQSRWYQQVIAGDYDAWMTLTTSESAWLLCDGDQASCGSKWLTPADAAADDWNAQDTTVRLSPQTGFDNQYDLNISVQDTVLGDPTILGVAQTYDANYNFCSLSILTCVIRYGWADIGDDAHSGPFGTENERRGTIAHEIGHLYALRHESVNRFETVLYPCGIDDGGITPYSIMSYNCIDPVEVGGFGIYEVQPWDVCGVNHAYHDPTIGFADCAGLLSETPTPSPSPSPSFTPTSSPSPTPSPTPTPTPTPTAPPSATATATPTVTPSPSPTVPPHQELWADADCDGDITSRDNQALQRRVLEQAPLSQTPPCPDIDDIVQIAGFGARRWGDADCDEDITTRDSQATLRLVLEQAPLSQTPPCPPLGSIVTFEAGIPASAAALQPNPSRHLHIARVAAIVASTL